VLGERRPVPCGSIEESDGTFNTCHEHARLIRGKGKTGATGEQPRLVAAGCHVIDVEGACRCLCAVLDGHPAEATGPERVRAFREEPEFGGVGAEEHFSVDDGHGHGFLGTDRTGGGSERGACGESCEGVFCSLLFGFLLAAASPGGKELCTDTGGDEKFAGVIRAGFFDDGVFGGAAELSLSVFLELALEILDIQWPATLQLFCKRSQNELSSSLHAAVEIHAGRERFHAGGKNRLRNLLQTTPDQDERFKVQRFGHPRARLTADEPAFHLCELTFALLGKELKQMLADDQSEHSVAKEFQAFVGIESSFGGGAVGEAAAQELPVAEYILNPCFTTCEQIVDLFSRAHAGAVLQKR